LLILDEPTNHLDIDSRRALLEALNNYEGAVILITHDRSLIDLVADRLWLAADGHIKSFRGDMDDYARFVLERARAGVRAPSQASRSQRRPGAAIGKAASEALGRRRRVRPACAAL
jgi:ATP-binding cassette subfamily F protein 3